MALLTLAMWLGTATFTPALAQSDVTFEPTWYMVVDWANLLDEGQETSAINDTWRLNLLGVPAQAVTELVESTPELARQRADALRLEHGIESAPNAGDGMLIYAAVNPSNRSLVNVAIAAGPNALPTGGLTQDNLAEIQSNIVVPQLTAGHPARAIVYAVRELIYQQVFTPPPSAPLTGLRASVHDILPWLAPVAAIPVAMVALRKARSVSGIRGALTQAAAPLVAGVVLAVVAIDVQSGPGIFWAVGLILVSVVILIVADRNLQFGDHRVLTTTPRPPGRIGQVTRIGS